MCTTLRTQRPIARKPHQCNACGGVIGKGDRYLRQTNVDSGDLYTWRAHELCEAIIFRDYAPYADECIAPDWGEMELSLREVIAGMGAVA